MAAEQRATVMDLTTGRKSGPYQAVPQGAGWASFALANVDRFPGPAFAAASDGCLIHANVHAEALVAALADEQSGIAALVQRCLASGAPMLQKLTLNGKSGNRHLDLHALPIALDESIIPLDDEDDDHRGVLVFARETTLEQNLTNALVESRQMFKDLLACSADFAWETDAHGLFRYVSPRGAFGYPAHELTGRRATDYLADLVTPSPFSARERIEDQTIAIRRSDGSRAVVHLAATPVLNQKGEWLGTRGICRDMTMTHYQDAAYGALQARHQLLTTLTGLARDVATHGQIMMASAAAIAQAVDADCWILRLEADHFVIDGAAGKRDSSSELVAAVTDALTRQVAAGRARRHAAIIDVMENRSVVIMATRHHGVVNGALVALRDADTEFDDHALTLLDEAAEQISLTIEQARARAAIDALTTTDELTGLLNRRAFEDFVEKRIAHQRRTGSAATLLLVELDHFEGIQEHQGRLAGDNAIRQIGEMLKSRSRVGDAIARLGGHRFALWLEDTPVEGAVHKARHIIRSCEDVTLGRVTGTNPVTVCIGVVPAEPQPRNTLAQMMEAAESALRHAKRQGHGQYALGALIPLNQ